MSNEAIGQTSAQIWTIIAWGIIASAGIWSIWGALNPFAGDSSNSRMATVYALAHYGTWEIDNPEQPNPFESGTVDKVRVDGKMYSSKPPVMPLAMTLEYIIARKTVGLNLDNQDDRTTLTKIMTITFITLPFVLSGFALLSILRHIQLAPIAQTIGLTAFMWGSEYAGYAATINNHVPATACLMMAIWGYIVLNDKKNVQTGILCLLMGFFMGLAVTVDLPAAIFVLILIAGYIAKFAIRNVLCGVAGFLIPLLVHCAVMIALSGSPLPFQMNHDYYMYQESYWRNPVGIDALNHPSGLYLFNMTFGSVGIFSLYPVLLIGALALLSQIRDRDVRTKVQAIAILAAMFILGTYYLTSTNNYGGASFGFRWLIITTPFLVIGAATLIDKYRNKWVTGFTVVLLAISIVSATMCRLNPWGTGFEWTTKVFGSLI